MTSDCTCPSRGESPHSIDCPESDWETTVDGWKAEIESLTLVELLASFGGSPHVYDPETQRCTCGALDHPDWGVTA